MNEGNLRYLRGLHNKSRQSASSYLAMFVQYYKFSISNVLSLHNQSGNWPVSTWNIDRKHHYLARFLKGNLYS